ncbi:MAG: hypothetical protein WC107_01960 [Patescibacteria group bacterium]
MTQNILMEASQEQEGRKGELKRYLSSMMKRQPDLSEQKSSVLSELYRASSRDDFGLICSKANQMIEQRRGLSPLTNEELRLKRNLALQSLENLTDAEFKLLFESIDNMVGSTAEGMEETGDPTDADRIEEPDECNHLPVR